LRASGGRFFFGPAATGTAGWPLQQLHGKEYSDEAQTWLAMTQHMYVVADPTLAQRFAERF